MPSRDATDRLPLIVKVARLYHEQKIKQPEIASRLNLAQSKVSRLLKEAGELGIVRTIVVQPEGLSLDLETAVRDRFGLRDVVIAEVGHDDAENETALLAAIGSVAAHYLEDTMQPGDRVGLSSWSSSLLAVVDSMTSQRTRRAESIVQVIGGVGDPVAQVKATHLAERLGRLTGGTVHYFAAPGVVATRAARDSLFDEPQIAAIRDEWLGLTMALVGIGSLRPSSLLAMSGNTLPDTDLRVLREHGAVGDVCLNFFDADGVTVTSSIQDRTLGIDAKTLKAIPRRVAVAAGRRKVTAITGALRGGWCDVLITDSNTARALIGESA